MQLLLHAILIVGGSAVVSVLGLLAVQRLVPMRIRAEHNDVAGFIYGVVGVMYAVVLAYVTIVVWQRYDTTGQIVDQEAVDLQNIFHDVEYFSGPERSNVQNIIKTYVETTINEEWPLLANGESSSSANQLTLDLREAIQQLPASTPKEQVMFDHVVTQYEAFLLERNLRIFESGVGLNPILWALLIIGALVTIGFTYFFGVEDTVSHGIMITALTLVVAGLLFMIQVVNNPFAGEVHVSDQAFRQALANLTA